MWKLWILLTLTVLAVTAEPEEEQPSEREARLLPIFQVVRFPNDVCSGTTRNGTCYTAEECSNLGGVNEGSCASGFGVCCVIKADCGDSFSVNNSYIVQAAVTSLTSPCTYKVCPCSTEICRIRYDFKTLSLASQATYTASATAATASTGSEDENYKTGDCLTDQFSISSPGLSGSPIICGYNTNQHMIIDSSGTECQTVNVNVGAETTTSRSWDIYVTQYTCGQEDLAGSPGCLQFYTGVTGLVKTFGYPSANTNAAAQAATTTHLKNQDYTVCVRTEKNYCAICWADWYYTAAAGSFGLSVSPTAAILKAAVATACTADYIIIPNGVTSTIAAITTPTLGTSRFCGRLLALSDTIAGASVCSRSYPFTLGVRTDDHEVCTNPAADMADDCEATGLPGGILGFALGYTQLAC